MPGIFFFQKFLWISVVGFLLQTQPAVVTGMLKHKQSGLVELVKMDPTIKLDIRYATANNFIGQPVYKEARAFLQAPAAAALANVSRKAKQHGFGLLVFDGYRPLQVTQLFWDLTPPDKRKFVANPKNGSRHNRGCAVDLSFYDLKTGKEVEMPSGYDEMNEKAYPNYTGGTKEQRERRDLLISLMHAEGFIVNSVEWWHYDYKDWMKYPLLDVPFSDIH